MKNITYYLVLILAAGITACIPNYPGGGGGTVQDCTARVLVPLRDPYASPQPGMSLKDATHHYMRFRISSGAEYRKLQSAGILLLDHPFDALPQADGTFKTEHTADYAVYYGVVPRDLDLSGLHAEKIREVYFPGSETVQRTGSVENTFSGQVTFFDPVDSTLKPLKGVQVIIRSGTLTASGHSDGAGNFSITSAAITRDTVEVLLRFENDAIEIHTLSLNDILGVRGVNVYSLGYRKACDYGDMNLVVDRNVNSAALHHSCAMLLGFNEYRDFAAANGFLMPDRKLLVWLGREAPISTSYAAPMLQNMTQQNLSNPAELLINLFGFPENLAMSMANTLKNELPDIYAPFYNRYSRYARASFIETIFHELSHASHFAKVGPDFWLPYVEYIYGSGGYGGDSLANSGIVSMSEAWAEDLSNIGLNYIYGNPAYLTLNENTNVNWIPYGLYYDVYDSGSNESFDQVSGIGFLQIYNLFTENTRSPEAMRESLKSAYPAQSQALDELFHRYGR